MNTLSPLGLVQIPINTEPNSPWPNSLPKARESRWISFNFLGVGGNVGSVP